MALQVGTPVIYTDSEMNVWPGVVADTRPTIAYFNGNTGASSNGWSAVLDPTRDDAGATANSFAALAIVFKGE